MIKPADIKNTHPANLTNKDKEALLIWFYWVQDGKAVPKWVSDHELWPGNNSKLMHPMNGKPVYVSNEKPLQNAALFAMNKICEEITGDTINVGRRDTYGT